MAIDKRRIYYLRVLYFGRLSGDMMMIILVTRYIICFPIRLEAACLTFLKSMHGHMVTLQKGKGTLMWISLILLTITYYSKLLT